ncbi:MAG TPA: hypothetical protein PLO37_18460 [Candidatus Hydrogenedentes bacterium]|nr:hypothetical protein [Candidatus Hydrogenedentota bacterium]
MLFLLREDLPPIHHPDTGEEIQDARRKIQHLVVQLQKSRTKILIPTPVLAEILAMFGGKADEIVRELSQNYHLEFAPFDTMSAIEAGMAFYSARQQGDKKGGSQRSWQRVKFDRQIVSIAKAHRATAVYSNDKEVLKWTEELGMKGIAAWDLDSPPPEQSAFEFGSAHASSDSESETERDSESTVDDD